MTVRPIGGFFPLRLPHGGSAVRSVLSQWLPAGAESWLLQNGRSALYHLWDHTKPAKIWLPAYICQEVAAAIPSGVVTAYYPVSAALAPDVAFLAAEVSDGEHVLAVDYFGRPPDKEFLSLVQHRTDVGWIEDRAQAVDPGQGTWGDWILYSPRKVLGVTDGGILVSGRKPLPSIPKQQPVDLGFMLSSLERFEDELEIDNARWYATYQRVEAGMTIGPTAMSRLSRMILATTDLPAAVARRKRSYAILHAHVGEWAMFPEVEVDFAPMGFPIRSRSGLEFSKALAAQRIFAARHWACLPSDAVTFASAHELAGKLVTLPCDDRYGDDDMQRVGAAARTLLLAKS